MKNYVSIDDLLTNATVYNLSKVELYKNGNLYQLTFKTNYEPLITFMDYVKENGIYKPVSLKEQYKKKEL